MIHSLPGLLLGCLLLLNACSYHLVGHGDDAGVIPADTRTLSIDGNADAQLLQRMRQRLQSEHYSIISAGDVPDEQHHIRIQVQLPAAQFVPSAYSNDGVATQYRMLLSGSIQVSRLGKQIWSSGTIRRRGDVFVSGGPTSIEASRERLLTDLSRQWLNDAIGRMRSGF